MAKWEMIPAGPVPVDEGLTTTDKPHCGAAEERLVHETGGLPRPKQTAACFGLGQPPIENCLFARPNSERTWLG